MFKKLVEWFTRLWRDDVPDAVERLYLDEYAPYIRDRYGIAQPFADEDKDSECRK